MRGFSKSWVIITQRILLGTKFGKEQEHFQMQCLLSLVSELNLGSSMLRCWHPDDHSAVKSLAEAKD